MSAPQRQLGIAVASLLAFLYGSSLSADNTCGGIALSERVDAGKLAPGESFHDCADCPEMVVVPAGSFEMGDTSGGGLERERPVHSVTIGDPFAVGKYEITYAEWDACVSAGGCSYRPDDQNWGRGRIAVKNVNWHDVKEYVAWLTCKTGAQYRMPSEAEWEYMARAGSKTKYPWGDEIGKGRALCLSCGKTWFEKTPVGSFAPNAFGVYDTVGSENEWIEDCWNNSYDGAPADGSTWATGNCAYRVMRGGGYYGDPKFQTSSYRNFKNSKHREYLFGLRVVRDINVAKKPSD